MRLGVRRLAWEDLPVRVAWFNTPSVYTHVPLDLPIGLARTEQWFRDTLMNVSRVDFTFTDAQRPQEEQQAFAGLTNIEPVHRRAEMYMVVRPGETGRGIGTAVLRWLCNYGFANLSLERIMVTTLADNQVARHLYARVGFVNEGVLRRHFHYQGRLVDRHVQGLLRSEWEQQAWHTPQPVSFSLDTGS